MRKRSAAVLAGVAILAAASGAGVHLWMRGQQRELGAATAALTGLTLPDPAGRGQALRQWEGQIVVVNFWATWCEPCREEVPALVRAQAKWGANGVQIVGIGIDSTANIRQFAAEYRINYPLVVAGPEVIEITRRLGNRAGGLPYTVILDRRGALASTHLGALSSAALDAALGPLTRKSL
jgi:thiol-disulfide isomerase/thioredoxin